MEDIKQLSAKKRAAASTEKEPDSKASNVARGRASGGGSKGKTKLDISLAAFSKMRTKYHAVVSSAKSLQRQIESSEDWSWANNASNEGKLSILTEELESAANTELLITETKELKINIGHEKLQVELDTFLGLKDAIDAVEKMQKRLTNMQKNSKA